MSNDSIGDQFDNVTVLKRANIYFDGKCISHTVNFSNGVRKTLGVILPCQLHFETTSAETMNVQSGRCRVRLDGNNHWQAYGPGDHFDIPGNSAFDIIVEDTLDYVCSYL